LEGRHEESQAMKKMIIQQRIDKANDVIKKVKGVGSSIMSKFMRGLDAILDSDSENEAEGNFEVKGVSRRGGGKLLDTSKLSGGGKSSRVAVDAEIERDMVSPTADDNKRLSFLPVKEEDMLREPPRTKPVYVKSEERGCVLS